MDCFYVCLENFGDVTKVELEVEHDLFARKEDETWIRVSLAIGYGLLSDKPWVKSEARKALNLVVDGYNQGYLAREHELIKLGILNAEALMVSRTGPSKVAYTDLVKTELSAA